MATLHLGPLLDSMTSYAQGLQSQALRVAEGIAEDTRRRTVERARQDEAWASMADEIEVWSEDGRYVIGVRDQELASQAFQIEYGDESRPPAPLFRLMGRDLAEAHQAANVTTTQGYSSREQ